LKKSGLVNKHLEASSRRNFLQASAMTGVAAVFAPMLSSASSRASEEDAQTQVPAFELDETSIAELQSGMQSGRFTARSIAEMYLARIDAIDKAGPALHSVIEINPDALSIADALDRERKQQGARGPMHGIPVLIKDNIDTADGMMTTAGSLALVGAKPLKDSFVARRLREAGALILGKTNPSEWANIRSNHSISGWSGRGGQTKCPYALDRNPSGSSSGSGAGVAANLAAVAVGTETDGSIVSPSSVNGVVGIKPTVGLISRSGIIPISHTQDSAGPMCRTVRDAAILLSVLAGEDGEDNATAAGSGKRAADYTKFLDADGLRGARIGVVRKYFGSSEKTDALIENSLATLKKLGAVLVDPVDFDTILKMFDNETLVLMYELKSDLNAYFSKLGPGAPVHSLKEVIDFNERARERELALFGQDFFLKAEEKGPLTTKEYRDALENNHRMARAEGIDAIMDKYKLDALVAPTNGPGCLIDIVNGDSNSGSSSNAAAVAGYPHITVPAGFVHGLPVGLSFFGRAWSEPTLIRVAYAFEQATKCRKPPKFLPTAEIMA
jgi:amidase